MMIEHLKNSYELPIVIVIDHSSDKKIWLVELFDLLTLPTLLRVKFLIKYKSYTGEMEKHNNYEIAF